MGSRVRPGVPRDPPGTAPPRSGRLSGDGQMSVVGAPARGGDLSSPPGQTPGSARDAARRLSASPYLSQRRLELLPLSGPGSVFAEVQGRRPGASTAPEDLAELVSSIASVGVLQPILVERLPDGSLRLVAGERRLRAARWGAANLPPNPHFEAIPAVVCPGPLPEEDRRTWQIAENLVRTDLAPGDLAAALVFERWVDDVSMPSSSRVRSRPRRHQPNRSGRCLSFHALFVGRSVATLLEISGPGAGRRPPRLPLRLQGAGFPLPGERAPRTGGSPA